MNRVHPFALLAALLLAPTAAWAQVPPGDNAPAEPEATPTPVPQPQEGDPPPQPIIIKRTRFARAGTMEAGASVGFTSAEEASGGNLTPSFGWFVGNNLELSALLGLHYVRAEGRGAVITTGLVEPSYHLPFGRTAFGFLGLGMGGSYVDEAGLGFALAPRVGARILLGDSSILTPSLSYQYTTHDTQAQSDEMLVVSNALAANIGYAVMW